MFGGTPGTGLYPWLGPGTENVPFFSRILDFKRDFLARLRNKRSHPRHRVGADFPLKASLALAGADKFNPDQPPVRGSGLIWSGRVGDISDHGLNIILSPAATTARGEPTFLRLALEGEELVIPCTVAHFRVQNRHALCGVRLEFDDSPTQLAYHQLVEAVKLGASFSATGPARLRAGFFRRSWRSSGRTLLTELREPESHALVHFELSLADHQVLGRGFPPGLEIQARAGQEHLHASEKQAEVHRLYRWLVANLPKGVPADLRDLMTRVGVGPTTPPGAVDWGNPATARAFTSTVIKVPLSAWQSPRPKTPVPTG